MSASVAWTDPAYEVCQDYVWQGIGGGMLKGAILKSIEASRRIGIRAILVHVIDETAPPFYDAYGFIRSPMGERTFVLPINTAVEAL